MDFLCCIAGSEDHSRFLGVDRYDVDVTARGTTSDTVSGAGAAISQGGAGSTDGTTGGIVFVPYVFV